jgi:hypothetical protein
LRGPSTPDLATTVPLNGSDNDTIHGGSGNDSTTVQRNDTRTTSPTDSNAANDSDTTGVSTDLCVAGARLEVPVVAVAACFLNLRSRPCRCR